MLAASCGPQRMLGLSAKRQTWFGVACREKREEKRRQRMLDNIPTEFFRICDFMLMSVEKLMILVVAKSTVESLIRIEQEFFHLLEVFNNLFFKLINFKFQYSYRELFTVGNFLQLQFFLDILGVVVNMLQLFDQI